MALASSFLPALFPNFSCNSVSRIIGTEGRPTDAERLLWRRLRLRQLEGYKFRRQVPLGPFIVDFLCLEANLVIELDGGQHVEAAGYDRNRTSYLQEQGFRVIRFWNGEVLQRTDEVVDEILRNLS
ncbi:MAG: endonuclease domain-containing protein [Thermoanaerobaculia bacterium]|nr:endonuclease domain-containing protein [Thermoanaerobaculia bacterium]